MDALTLFGLAAVCAMLVFYALEERSPWLVLAFTCACAAASVYGFLQGAWPFGLVEGVWTIVALKRWRAKAAGCAPSLRASPRFGGRRVERVAPGSRRPPHPADTAGHKESAH